MLLSFGSAENVYGDIGNINQAKLIQHTFLHQQTFK